MIKIPPKIEIEGNVTKMEMVKDIDKMQQLSSPIMKRLLVAYQDQK